MTTRAQHAKRPGRSAKWIRPDKRQRIYARDHFKCVWCQRRPDRLTLDHFLPKSCGGSNSESNLLTSCTKCNYRRQDKPALEFAFEIAGPLFPGLVADIMERCLGALDRIVPTHTP